MGIIKAEKSLLICDHYLDPSERRLGEGEEVKAYILGPNGSRPARTRPAVVVQDDETESDDDERIVIVVPTDEQGSHRRRVRRCDIFPLVKYVNVRDLRCVKTVEKCQKSDPAVFETTFTEQEQQAEPCRLEHRIVCLARVIQPDRDYWAYLGAIYSSPEDLEIEEFTALLHEAEHRSRARIANSVRKFRNPILARQERREPIPDDVKMFVWTRDGGMCVKCGTDRTLEFDHIIPLALGGSNTARNLQLLCDECNRAKGATLT